jgi:2',3'-cyclic-nucleotide 2'-phosphodiesterase (5'-nucleotidase family)
MRPSHPRCHAPSQPGYPGARFPVLAANVLAGGQPLLPPTWVVAVGGVRVGFIGAVTRSTPSIVVPSGVAGLRFTDEADAINRAAAALDAQGVKALVVLVHEGGETGAAGQAADWNDPACPGWRGDMRRMAERISQQVDLILTAHTHQGYNCLIDGRPVMQALSFGRAVSVADLVIDARTGEVDRAATRSRNLPVFNDRTDAAARQRLLAAEPAPWADALRQARPVAAVQQTVAAYAQAAAPRAQRPVGRIGGSFDRRGRTDSAAGRLVADAQLAATRAPDQGGAQLALMNPGGLRADLPCSGTPPCTVTYGDAFSMQPFGNSLVVMTLTGVELKALLEQQQPAGRASPSFLSPSAGLAYRWLASAPPGQRVQGLTLHGQPVGPKQALRVTVNSFMADGGDGYIQLRAGRDRLGGMQDVDALVAHLQTTRTPDPCAAHHLGGLNRVARRSEPGAAAMRITLLGAGHIGQTIARLLATSGDYEVTVFDRDPQALARLGRAAHPVPRGRHRRPGRAAAGAARPGRGDQCAALPPGHLAATQAREARLPLLRPDRGRGRHARHPAPGRRRAHRLHAAVRAGAGLHRHRRPPPGRSASTRCST